MATTQTTYKWPTPWPLRIIGWVFGLIVAIAVLVAVAAFIAIGATGVYYEMHRTTGDDVEAMIKAELPERASTDQIFDFLEAHGMTYGSARPSTAEDQKLAAAGVPAGTMTITGTLRNDGYTIKHRDVEAWFVLDEHGLLDGYLVYDVGR